LTTSHHAHSETHLVESREYWWNPDYIELLAQRLNLEECHNLADIGCGYGLMGFLFAQHLPEHAKVTGVDREKRYVKRAEQKARKAAKKTGVDFEFLVGEASHLPLNDDSQDIVMCQTLLMHVKQPDKVIEEMKRCTRPGGQVVAIEPNNLASNLMFDKYSQTDYDVDDMMEFLEVRLRCEKGKKNLGEGFSSIGDSLPDLYHTAGLQNIRMYISDKSLNLIPPYDTREKRLRAAQMIDWIENQTGGFGYDENWRYYRAGGGGKKTFNAYWEKVSRYQQQLLRDLKNQECFLSGGNLMYVVVGEVGGE